MMIALATGRSIARRIPCRAVALNLPNVVRSVAGVTRMWRSGITRTMTAASATIPTPARIIGS